MKAPPDEEPLPESGSSYFFFFRSRPAPVNIDTDDMTSGSAETRDWITRLPKVELHVHLEGAIPHESLWELIRKYGGDPSVPSFAALSEKFVFRDFSHFVEVWSWKNRFLRQEEDVTFIAETAARGLRPGRLAEAVRRGLDRVPEVRANLVAANTDDPKMFGNSLVEEYLCLIEKLDLSRDEVRTLVTNAVEACWLIEPEKRALLESFRRDPVWSE